MAARIPRTRPEGKKPVAHLRTLEIGTVGRVLCLLVSFAMVVFAPGWRVLIGLAVVLCTGLIMRDSWLHPLVSVRLWALLLVIFVPLGLAGGQPDLGVGGVPVSSAGLVLGAQMVARALAILIAVMVFVLPLSVSELTSLSERLGVKGLGFAIGVAVNMLPSVRQTAQNVYHALRLRGGFRRRWWRSARLWFVTTVVSSLRHAEDIVLAAEARAFSVSGTKPVPLVRRRADLPTVGAYVLAALLVVFL